MRAWLSGVGVHIAAVADQLHDYLDQMRKIRGYIPSVGHSQTVLAAGVRVDKGEDGVEQCPDDDVADAFGQSSIECRHGVKVDGTDGFTSLVSKADLLRLFLEPLPLAPLRSSSPSAGRTRVGPESPGGMTDL